MAETHNTSKPEKPTPHTSAEMIAYGEQLVSQGIALRETNSRAGVEEGSRLIANGEKYIARGNQMRSDLRTPFSPLTVSIKDRNQNRATPGQDDATDTGAVTPLGTGTGSTPRKSEPSQEDIGPKKASSGESAPQDTGGKKKKRKKGKKKGKYGTGFGIDLDDIENATPRASGEGEEGIRAIPLYEDDEDIEVVSEEEIDALMPPRRSEFPLNNRIPEMNPPEHPHPSSEKSKREPIAVKPHDGTQVLPPLSDAELAAARRQRGSGDRDSSGIDLPTPPAIETRRDRPVGLEIMVAGDDQKPAESGFGRFISALLRIIALLCAIAAAANAIIQYYPTKVTLLLLAAGLIVLTAASFQEATARRRLGRPR